MKDKIEKIFRHSTSPNQIFDAFENAVNNQINDVDVYKTLLSNKILNPDEVKFYTEVLSRKFNEVSYELYIWTGNVLENCNSYDLGTAFEYYKKAHTCKEYEHTPLLKIIEMYNADLNLPDKKEIINFCSAKIEKVHQKSKVYNALGEFCGKFDKQELKNKYLELAAKFARKGR